MGAVELMFRRTIFLPTRPPANGGFLNESPGTNVALVSSEPHVFSAARSSTIDRPNRSSGRARAPAGASCRAAVALLGRLVHAGKIARATVCVWDSGCGAGGLALVAVAALARSRRCRPAHDILPGGHAGRVLRRFLARILGHASQRGGSELFPHRPA